MCLTGLIRPICYGQAAVHSYAVVHNLPLRRTASIPAALLLMRDEGQRTRESKTGSHPFEQQLPRCSTPAPPVRILFSLFLLQTSNMCTQPSIQLTPHSIQHLLSGPTNSSEAACIMGSEVSVPAEPAAVDAATATQTDLKQTKALVVVGPSGELSRRQRCC